jgi:putative sterol carrier protein
MNDYIIRNFVEGDEEKIIELFNETFKRFTGYVPRTVEYWRWCYLRRPDVRKDGIFLIFSKETGDLEGYAAVGLSGNIWELCAKPNCEDVALILLEKAVNYLEKMGVSAVNVNVPEGDKTLNKACRKMGFARVDVHKLFLGVLSFRKLISMLASDKKNLSKNFKEKICLKIKDAPFWIEKAISVSIDGERIEVTEGLTDSPTILVKTDVKTLLAILIGVLSLWRALLSLKVRVKPFWKIPVLNRFLSSLRMNPSWFWPLGDFG